MGKMSVLLFFVFGIQSVLFFRSISSLLRFNKLLRLRHVYRPKDTRAYRYWFLLLLHSSRSLERSSSVRKRTLAGGSDGRGTIFTTFVSIQLYLPFAQIWGQIPDCVKL